MERTLMYICLAGLVLSSLIWLANVAYTANRSHPQCTVIQKGKTRLVAILFLAVLVIKAIVYGGSKAPTSHARRPPRPSSDSPQRILHQDMSYGESVQTRHGTSTRRQTPQSPQNGVFAARQRTASS